MKLIYTCPLYIIYMSISIQRYKNRSIENTPGKIHKKSYTISIVKKASSGSIFAYRKKTHWPKCPCFLSHYSVWCRAGVRQSVVQEITSYYTCPTVRHTASHVNYKRIAISIDFILMEAILNLIEISDKGQNAALLRFASFFTFFFSFH